MSDVEQREREIQTKQNLRNENLISNLKYMHIIVFILSLVVLDELISLLYLRECLTIME